MITYKNFILSEETHDDVRQYLQYGTIKIRGSRMDFIFAFADNGKGNAIPVGFISYQRGEIGIIYVTDDMRRHGVAKELLRLADKESGTTLVDDGELTKDGEGLMRGLGRPISKNTRKPDSSHMGGQISRVMFAVMFAPVDSFKVLKKYKKFKG